MAFCLGNGMWEQVFAVPSAVTDQYLKIASGLSVKVLLLILRNSGNLNTAEIAVLLGQSVSDIQDAIYYWVECGVLVPKEAAETCVVPKQSMEQPNSADSLPAAPVEEAVCITQPLQQVIENHTAAEPARKVQTVTSGRRRLTTAEINEMAQADENIEYLLQETQSVIGKPLTPIVTETVMVLYSYHGMQPDLILMLMHYCVSNGKESMRYIEKMAADWLDRGIDSHEKAEEELVRLSRSNTAERKIKAAFGIYDRNLVTSEKKYIEKWMNEYQQDIQLICIAFERAVELKGSLNFPYINGILSNWYQRGVTTTAQAIKEIRENKPPSKQAASLNASYDMNELENMITCGDI